MADRSSISSDFEALSLELEANLGEAERALLARLKVLRPTRTGCRGFADLGKQVVAPLQAAANIPDTAARATLSRALIAALAAETLTIIKALPVPQEVVERSERWLPTLLTFLRGGDHDDYWYPNDLFLKDYRFVTGITVPCGAQVIDLADGIGPKTAFKLGMKHPFYFWAAFRRPWFQIHTESRYLDEFNDPGWTAFYKLAADLLLLNPHIQGIVGTSWFYDPALSVISPRLSYLREYPVQHGALLVEQGTTAFDIKSATATSDTRRKLFEAGKYRPRCHTMIWPRAAMLEWANEYSA